MDIFKDLTDQEIRDYKEWARKNWVVGDSVSEMWHPVIQKECEVMTYEYDKGTFIILDTHQAAEAWSIVKKEGTDDTLVFNSRMTALTYAATIRFSVVINTETKELINPENL